MKILELSRDALGLCAAAALFAGCGGGLPSPTNAPLPQNAARIGYDLRSILLIDSDSKLNGETFTSTKVRSHCDGKQTMSGSFHAHGSASGPVPGTFAASGQVTQSRSGRHSIGGWGLDETFTITSTSQEVSGHVESVAGSMGNPLHCSHHMLSFKLGGRYFSLQYKLKGHRGGGTASATLENDASGQTLTQSFH